MLARLEKCDISIEFLTKKRMRKLYGIYYIRLKIRMKYKRQKFADKHDLNAFLLMYSEILPLKRIWFLFGKKQLKIIAFNAYGKILGENSIDKGTRERIDKIITGEYEKIEKERGESNSSC